MSMNDRDTAEPPHAVLARFPQSDVAIRELFDVDEEFRELCGDYAECLAVIDRLDRGQGAVDDRIGQYRELRENLESELLRRISAPIGAFGISRPSPAPGSR